MASMLRSLRLAERTLWVASGPNGARDIQNRKEIVDAVKQLWQKYGLEKKTKFDTRVEKVYQDNQGRWIINDESNGRYDGVIAAIGTCGDPKNAKVAGQENYQGKIFHSSQLDGKESDTKGKKVLVIGGGASAIEAMEFTTAAGAEKTYILSRSEKWIIPRNPLIDMLLALNIFGQETRFSHIPERLLRLLFYRDLSDIAPAENSGKGLFMETPMVNNDVLEQIRSGKAQWLRGDIKNFEKNYEPPNWYLQVFPPKHMSICANNCTYVNAIGAVGNWHIGIYTRFLLMFLVDPLAQPTEGLMKLWIDFTRWVKRFAPTGAFDFFTYSELIYWFVFVISINPFRWKWALFVLTGRGSALPKAVVEQEDRVREKWTPKST
ncbi:putative FAD/NAD(P)-binding domain superfamily, NAD(P)-binding domain superfamily [Septoria linicola]|nr:putative FAD/NAD(P)-binding domain superfamily, NAD(P)-binding domain superfamily [Septoria linicola]